MIPEEDFAVVGQTAPKIDSALLDGGDFSLDAQRGKIVVLSFWASWCTPCRFELPALDALQRERSDIQIFAVNVDRERSKAEGFLRKVDFKLPIVWDNRASAMGQYNVTSMPTLFVVDRNGTVKFRKSGFSKEKGLVELEAALAGLK